MARLPCPNKGWDLIPCGLEQGVAHQVCVLNLSMAIGGSGRENTRDKVTREPTGSGGDSDGDAERARTPGKLKRGHGKTCEMTT